MSTSKNAMHSNVHIKRLSKEMKGVSLVPTFTAHEHTTSVCMFSMAPNVTVCASSTTAKHYCTPGEKNVSRTEVSDSGYQTMELQSRWKELVQTRTAAAGPHDCLTTNLVVGQQVTH